MMIPVLLSGGTGTRLWPMSRQALPKPFMKLTSNGTLLKHAYERATSALQACGRAPGEIVSVTNRDYYFLSKEEWRKTDLTRNWTSSFLLEPEGRNTAPAIALAAHYVQAKYGPEAKVLVLAADHLVTDQHAFNEAVHRAVALADKGFLVTFGIQPDSPHQGYGYIEAGAALPGGHTVKRFVEKPSRATAEAYLQKGGFFWNSGIFCFQAGVMLAQLEQHAPVVSQTAERCWQASWAQGAAAPSMIELAADEFEKIPAGSIDYALFEHSLDMAVVPADIGWSDVGSWDAVKALVEPDQEQNRAVGEALFVDSSETFVMSEDRIVVALGVNDLTIIDTRDALLVARQDKMQQVRQVVDALKEREHDSYKEHTTVRRPWGSYTVLERGTGFKIKRIEVKPGGQLSLQSHEHRSEHWVVVCGRAHVVNGEREYVIEKNESTYVQAGSVHRLENKTQDDLILIEVQSGDYLGEDDITRFDDEYGRT